MATEENIELYGRASDKWPSSSPTDGRPRHKKIEKAHSELLRQLRESNNQECTEPYFEQQLWDHLNRFSTRYATCLTRAEDVLLHMRLLDLVKDPTNQPAIDVHLTSDLSSSQRPMHEITISTYGLKDVGQLSSLINNMALGTPSAYFFSTDEGYYIGAFTVDDWTYEETDQLRVILGKEVLKNEKQDWASHHNFSYLDVPNDLEIDLKCLNLGKQVSSSSNADWYKGTYYDQEVAIKIFKCENVNSNLQKEFAHELFIMRNVNHKNIVQFLGACTKPPSLCIVTEFMSGGRVYDNLYKKKGVFKLKALCRVALDVAKGMNYLHQTNRVYKNLKAANLLMDEHEVVKMTDFGVARKSQSGAYQWVAPEVMDHQPYTHKADVYSFGVVLWELLTAKLPYKCSTLLQAIVGVIQKDIRPAIPKNTHPKLAELIKKCWHQDPTTRPEFPEIIETLKNIANEVEVEEGKEKSCWGVFSF